MVTPSSDATGSPGEVSGSRTRGCSIAAKVNEGNKIAFLLSFPGVCPEPVLVSCFIDHGKLKKKLGCRCCLTLHIEAEIADVHHELRGCLRNTKAAWRAKQPAQVGVAAVRVGVKDHERRHAADVTVGGQIARLRCGHAVVLNVSYVRPEPAGALANDRLS